MDDCLRAPFSCTCTCAFAQRSSGEVGLKGPSTVQKPTEMQHNVRPQEFSVKLKSSVPDCLTERDWGDCVSYKMGISARSLTHILSSGSGWLQPRSGSSWVSYVSPGCMLGVPSSGRHSQQMGLQDCQGKKWNKAPAAKSAYSAVSWNLDCFCSPPFLDLENRRLRESASESFDVWPVLWRGQLYHLVQLPACRKAGTDYLHLVRKCSWYRSGNTGAVWDWESTSLMLDHCWFLLTEDLRGKSFALDNFSLQAKQY